MRKNTPLQLPAADRAQLEKIVGSGSAKAREIKHANVLLKLAEGWQNKQVAEAFDVSEKTVIAIRRRFVAEGVESAIKDKPRSGAPRRIDGAVKAITIATACSKAPAGHARWTLRLLANRLVELEIVDEISPETVRQMLKKTN